LLGQRHYKYFLRILKENDDTIESSFSRGCNLQCNQLDQKVHFVSKSSAFSKPFQFIAQKDFLGLWRYPGNVQNLSWGGRSDLWITYCQSGIPCDDSRCGNLGSPLTTRVTPRAGMTCRPVSRSERIVNSQLIPGLHSELVKFLVNINMNLALSAAAPNSLRDPESLLFAPDSNTLWH
jgi:hypothetical protein